MRDVVAHLSIRVFFLLMLCTLSANSLAYVGPAIGGGVVIFGFAIIVFLGGLISFVVLPVVRRIRKRHTSKSEDLRSQ